VELTAESARIPHLVPAEGDHQAGAAWDAYVAGFAGGRRSAPVVNSETGEVTQDADGKKTEPWDRGVTVLDPLAQVMQRVYSNGVLVTVNEGTRIRPLSIPVKATLLGQQAERAVGALTQKQSFSLQVLDESIGKEVEKCRKITDLIEVLTFPLSLGNRWLPERAQELLDRERKAREERGRVALRRALGGKDVGSYVTERRRSIQKDLNDMYRQLGQGDVVPEEKVNSVLSNIEARLNAALNQAITPTFTYNRIGPPDLAGNASEENWDQPAALLMRAARTQREALVDGYFSRRISGMSFAEDELCDALNVFDDTILKNPIARRARSELEELDEIESKDLGPKSKFTAVWKIIRR
jgi:hypothetical protein